MTTLLAAGAVLATLSPIAGSACLERVKNSGLLSAGSGVVGDKPSLWQDESGRYQGIDADLLRQIATRLRIPNIRFVPTEWNSLIPGLLAKRWDIILSDIEITQERAVKQHIDFSRPYFLLYDYVIVLEDSPIRILSDLRGKTLGSTLGTSDSLTAHQLVSDGVAARVEEFATFEAPIVALENGQVDAAVLDQATLLGQRARVPNLRTVGEAIKRRAKPEWAKAEAQQAYRLGSEGIATRRECKDLLHAIDAALTDMETDGTRQAILSKYGVWEAEQVKLTK